MPRPPVRPHPAKPFRTWRDAARDRQIVTIRCNACRQTRHYLPEDLAEVFGADQPAHLSPFACSRCRTADYMNIVLRIPSAAEALDLKVRRPVKPVRRWTWRTVPLAGE